MFGINADLDCISHFKRIEEILGFLNEHTRPIPKAVAKRIDYPASDSPYCRTNPHGGYFTVAMMRDTSSVFAYIDGVCDRD
jgi:hypothetical protein